MMPLAIGPEPEILKQKSKEWGNEYNKAKDAGVETPERYRRDDIRDALRTETHGKCAYCESLIEHISYANIEHIIPKSAVPMLVCAWENLTLACQKCNNHKGTYYSTSSPLLNPYVDDVLAAMTFYGPMALDCTDQGKLTISRIRLNRPDLLFRRFSRLQEIANLRRLISMAADKEALKAALEEELNDLLSEASEYTRCSRCFVEDIEANGK